MKNKKIAILGLGVEGQALFKFLSRDQRNIITICDKKSKNELEKIIPNFSRLSKTTNFSSGDNYLKQLNQFDTIYRSPGIPIKTKEIQIAKRNGVKISSSIKLFFDLFRGTIIGITGTKGKGTTSTLVYSILKANNKKVILGGNIGSSLLPALSKLNAKTQDYIVVLELSSFQLQDLEKSPHIAAFLNFSPDHLNHHKNLAEYFRAKTNIVTHQKKNDYIILNFDINKIRGIARLTPAKKYYFSNATKVVTGSFVRNNKIIVRKNNIETEIIDISQINLKGNHNLKNILAAITITMPFNPDKTKLKNIIKSFKGLPHRLEFVKKINGVKYYNDSAATNTAATIAAINSFDTPTTFIMGGASKGENYKDLGKAIINSRVKGVILIGETSDKIQEAILSAQKHGEKSHTPTIIKTKENNMNKIINVAKSISSTGDSIVLSPASASFDMFYDYKERGECFKQAIKD